MVFVITHIESLEQFNELVNKYAKYNKVIICGTSNIPILLDAELPYHPLFFIDEHGATQAQRQAYIDCMLRAIQIEVPNHIYFNKPTLLDNITVVNHIKTHAATVGVSYS
jgi:hypothetical protein